MDLLTPNTGTIFWTVLSFLLLMLILKKYAWKPILENLDKREHRIQSALDESEKNQKEAERILAEQKELLQKARKDGLDMLAENRKDAERIKKEIVDQAHKESVNLLEKAKREIEHNTQTAIAEIKNYAVDLSIAAAQKVIGENLTTEQHRTLIKNQLKELSQQ
jgi:F-type H+-transporting ATPase subunit b